MYSRCLRAFKITNLACKLQVLNQMLFSTKQLKYGLRNGRRHRQMFF